MALVNDRVKLLAYRILDPAKAKTPFDVALKAAGTAPDLDAKIAAKDSELYEREGHSNGHANQDWLEAEQEVKKEEVRK